MKNSIYLALLLSSFSFAQNRQDLEKNAQKMYDASYNMNFVEVLDLTYPKLFDIVPRDKMLEMLNKTFENETYKVRLVFITPKFIISEIKKIEDKTIDVITYTNAMRITFEQKLTQEKADEIVKAYKETGAYTVVNYEKDRNSFYIEGKSTLLAIADVSTDQQWKFVNYDKRRADMMTKIVGENILKALGL
ncbi:hypothetical protein OX284_008250 [Flavobacterium sp. SUN046]|uniref:hypothetical protein n=1 Tax=Flavobacterium sp. SUN046 TaxID=3002440 RepID=UPI002DB9DFB9|nr:hypothetical protein [Flavobacterium sp. SUN046]MEC4049418.1 hypothetical protein [Flavobacterium sp. SUN046]